MEFIATRNGQQVDPGRAIREDAKRLSPPQRARILAEAERAMDEYLDRVTGTLAQRHGRPYPQGGGRTLQARSGRGIARLRDYTTAKTGQDVEGTVHLTDYMSRHEFGGIIRARGGKYLAVPLSAALNSNGTLRARARSFTGTYVVKGKSGLVIMQRRAGRDVPLFALRSTVRIRPRLGLRKELKRQRHSLQKNVVRRIQRLMRETA